LADQFGKLRVLRLRLGEGGSQRQKSEGDRQREYSVHSRETL